MRSRKGPPSDQSCAPDTHRTSTTSMNAPLAPWLLSHLGSGVLLGVVLLTMLLTLRRASAAQRCCVIGVFLAAMAVVAPLPRTWWPEISIPVKREAKPAPIAPPLILDAPDGTAMPAASDAGTSGRATSPVSPTFAPGATLVIIWAVGVGLLLLRLVAGWWQWRRLWMGARASDNPGVLDSQVEVRVSASIRVPMSSGRCILMPEDWLRWSRQDQCAALEHELAHWRHRDGPARWLAAVATALHWPSPLVWLAERHLRLAQEQRCDEAVLRSGADVVSYGQLLMRCAKSIGLRHPWLPSTVATMARPAQLALRIEYLAGGTQALRPARWWHVLWPLLLAGACLQALHLRLVAESGPLPQSAKEAAQEEMLGLQIKIITSSSAQPPTLLPSNNEGKPGILRLSQDEFNPLLRELLRDKHTEVISYPGMLTLPDREVMIRNVVLPGDVPATLEIIGQTGPPWSGSIISLTGTLHADGIELNGGVGFNRVTKELDGGRAEHEGQKMMIEKQKVAEGGTLVLGPLRGEPSKRGAGRRSMWVFITPARIDAASAKAQIDLRPETAQEQAAAELRKALARPYKIEERSWQAALLHLAADAGIQMAMADAQGPGDGPLKRKETSSPFSLIEQICAEHHMRLSHREGMWLIHPEFAPCPQLGPPAALPKESSLRTAAARSYEFSQTSLNDVIRLAATDAEISFIGLPDDSMEGQRLVTFSFNSSPFTVLENLCRLYQLDLAEENGIWHVRSRTEGEKSKAVASVGLRAMPPKPYAFSRAVLGDVLRYLAKDAGMAISVPENDRRMEALVTFSIKAAPYSVMETLCQSNGVRLEFKEGLWQVR